jgi:hypothetical protein
LLVAAAGFGAAGFALFIGDRGPESSTAAPTKYHILLPDESLGTDDDGLQMLDAATNLPNGTQFDLSIGSPDIEGESGAGVKDGLIRIRVLNNSCREINGVLRSPQLRISVIVAPFHVFLSSGGFGSPPLDDRTKQPAEVRAVLGDRFEQLSGEQVEETDQGKMLKAERTYRLPVRTCTHKLVDTAGGGLRQIPLESPREGEVQRLPWCPDLQGARPVEGGNDAAEIALRFDRALFNNEVRTYRALADPVVRFPSDWYPAASQEPGLPRAVVVASFPASDGEAVARSCGQEAAHRTWQVVLGDPDTRVALVSYYLILRAKGWKVWGSLEGHGETTKPYDS